MDDFGCCVSCHHPISCTFFIPAAWNHLASPNGTYLHANELEKPCYTFALDQLEVYQHMCCWVGTMQCEDLHEQYSYLALHAVMQHGVLHGLSRC